MTTRALFLSILGFGLVLAGACGGDDGGGSDVDSGTTTGDGGTDAGSGPEDAGTDAGGGGTDAGPAGCTEDCEYEELALGADFSCVRRASGEIRCWGGNGHFQLGDGREFHGTDCSDAGDVDPVDCTGPVTARVRNAVQITARGALSICARTDTDQVRCWGLAGVPETPGGDTRAERDVAELFDVDGAASDASDGWLATCAVVGGEVFCMGDNESGQAGADPSMEVRVPTRVGDLTGIVDVEVGVFATFACARSAETVWCWGSNEHGQLGDGASDHGRCMHAGSGGHYDCSTVPVEVSVLGGLEEGLAQLTLGARHACALTTTGTVYCWGDNALGQLGLGDTRGRDEPTEVTALSGERVTQISAGSTHTCALLESGAIKCWGAHDEGQLGDGQEINSHDTCRYRSSDIDCSPSPVDVVTIDDATFIAAGSSHTCAVRGTDQVWCWGLNHHMQLATGAEGDAARERRVEPVMAMGIEDY